MCVFLSWSELCINYTAPRGSKTLHRKDIGYLLAKRTTMRRAIGGKRLQSG